MSMTAMELRDVLTRTLNQMPAHAEELRELDAALGDGDLGITVSAGSNAVIKALAALPAEASFAEILVAAGKAFSTANPSTFAALIGGGMLAASKAMAGTTSLGKAEAGQIGQAVAGRIADRGKSKLGDKTVLDALIPSLEVLASTDTDVLAAMIACAREQVEATAKLQSQKGRAAWVQERSVGHPDPGATAYLRFLEALKTALGG
jgi:phosphoenolpyruvate---glycerone phosphotransferase subunit DhaL